MNIACTSRGACLRRRLHGTSDPGTAHVVCCQRKPWQKPALELQGLVSYQTCCSAKAPTNCIGCNDVLQPWQHCAKHQRGLWLSAEEARTGPLSLFVALPDLQALSGLQQEDAEGGNGWVVAAKGSVAMDTSDDLEVTGSFTGAAHSVV